MAASGALAAALVALIAFLIVGPGRSKPNVGTAAGPAAVAESPRQSNSPASPSRPNRQKPSKPAVATTQIADARVDSLVRGAGSAYLNLASEAAGAVTAAAVLVPSPGPLPPTTPAADKDGRWVDEVGREFAPVTRNLSDAFEFLLDAMPAEKRPAT